MSAPSQMRQHPIGTGPFKFVEFKPNQSIKVVRNPDYWKPGLPYLDGIEWTIIPNRSTAILAFIAGNFDMTFPYEVTIPMLKDVHAQMPEAMCETEPLNVAPNLLITQQAAFRQSRVAPGDRDDDRPQGVHRHSRRRARAISAPRCCRARKASGRCRRR